ncbi:hypothetical protein IAT38_000115 [Cryptococcus sp. DSM 104549]
MSTPNKRDLQREGGMTDGQQQQRHASLPSTCTSAPSSPLPSPPPFSLNPNAIAFAPSCAPSPSTPKTNKKPKAKPAEPVGRPPAQLGQKLTAEEKAAQKAVKDQRRQEAAVALLKQAQEQKAAEVAWEKAMVICRQLADDLDVPRPDSGEDYYEQQARRGWDTPSGGQHLPQAHDQRFPYGPTPHLPLQP